jgi:hypothetical protein
MTFAVSAAAEVIMIFMPSVDDVPAASARTPDLHGCQATHV